MDIKYVFILSTGRTATKFLAKYFEDNYSTVLSKHEPKGAIFYRFLSFAYFANYVPKKLVLLLLKLKKHSINKKLRKTNRTIYIEATPFLSPLSLFLKDVFENIQIVHIVRDPYNYVHSAMKHGSVSGIKKILKSILPFWDLPIKNKRNLSKIERLAVFWRIVNTQLNKNKEIYNSDGYLLVKYEDIFQKTTGMPTLESFIGLDYEQNLNKLSFKEKINEGIKYHYPKAENWESKNLKLVKKHCYELMKFYNYKTK
jgi:hypothetical protein